MPEPEDQETREIPPIPAAYEPPAPNQPTPAQATPAQATPAQATPAQAAWPARHHSGYSGRPTAGPADGPVIGSAEGPARAPQAPPNWPGYQLSHLGHSWAPGGWTPASDPAAPAVPPPPPPYTSAGAAGAWGVPPAPGPQFAGSEAVKPRRRGRRAAAAAVATGLLAAGAVGGVIGHSIQPTGSASGTSNGTNNSGGSNSNGSPFNGFPFNGGTTNNGSGSGSGSSSGSGPADAAAIASRVDAGLVDVNTTIDYGRAQGAGTGIVLTSDGEVLTNNHVIDGATSISVTDIGNGRTYSATVVGYDRSTDVAILRLQGASGLKTVSIGNSSAVSSGQQVVGIGNAGGAGGTPSYAGGTVTATNQSITASDELTGTSEQLSGMIETNADIQAGDSGGPLVDSAGRVIGMDTAGSSSSLSFQVAAGQGYAIPINKAMNVAAEIESGSASTTVHIGPTAFLGVQIAGANVGAGSGASGAAISGTVSGSPAYGAGLTSGDVITAVGGRGVSSNADLETVLQQDRPGQTVQIKYTDSNGQQHTASVTLASGPPA